MGTIQFDYSKSKKVDSDVLGALKKAAELMEQGRTLFRYGAGNQLYPMLASYGHAYVAWRVSKRIEFMVKCDGRAQRYAKMVAKAKKGGATRNSMEEMAKDHVLGIMMGYGSRGGNCMENAEYMAYAVIRNKGLGNGYTQLHRVYLGGVDHEIVVVSHEKPSRKRPDIMIDLWIPSAQACLARHSAWGEDNKPSWSLDLRKKNLQEFDYVKLRSYLIRKVQSEKKKIETYWTTYTKGPGLKAEVHYQCPTCKRKWHRNSLKKKELKKPFENKKKGETIYRCPKCGKETWNKLTFLKDYKDQVVYYLPPFREPGQSSKLNIEMKKNLVMSNYGNDGIIDFKVMKDNTVYVFTYTDKDKPGAEDFEYWKNHSDKMRVYRWGTMFKPSTYKRKIFPSP